MSAWWDGLSALQRIYGLVAVPATLVLILQTILSLAGLGHDTGDADAVSDAGGHDFPEAGESDKISEGLADDGFRLFTLRGLTAFFTLFGWTGFALAGNAVPSWLTVPGSALAGFAGMAVIGLMFYGFVRLQASGNMELKRAVGLSATVYIRIPESRSGQGKVQVMLQERLTELPAVTDETYPLLTGRTVRVLGVIDGRILLVGAPTSREA